ncbi:hypothetical protein LG52_2701 [Geobacillus kaustophilus]|uniref:Uncharacterized protein n=1 Tax=Geobacillus kaustophilus TaxID=1462 RepID=A0A0D8BWY0_GEOKU|nr:hypothetical protein LG52_2701 [Geobacillus kaustophilus]
MVPPQRCDVKRCIGALFCLVKRNDWLRPTGRWLAKQVGRSGGIQECCRFKQGAEGHAV